jgi:hypothetical protein
VEEADVAAAVSSVFLKTWVCVFTSVLFLFPNASFDVHLHTFYAISYP